MDINIEKNAHTNLRIKLIIIGVSFTMIACCFYIYSLFTTQSTLLVARESTTFITVKPEEFQDVLITRAITVPKESTIISSERGGKVIEIAKTAFEAVNKGDVIIRLSNYDFMLETTAKMADITEQINNLRNMKMQLEQDNRDTKLSLQEAQHQIEVVSKNLVRHQVLDTKSMIAKSELENQKDILKNWKIKSEILLEHNDKNQKSLPKQLNNINDSILLLERMMGMIEMGIDQLVITAPIDGSLSVLDIELGQQIKPGEKIAVIDNFNSYYFNVFLSEYYLDKIKPQTRIIAKINGQDIVLLIESVSTVIDNGKFKAKLTPTQLNKVPLKRGQSIEIEISLQEDKGKLLLVPNESIISDRNGGNYLYVYQQQYDHAIKTKVEIKRRNAEKTEITAGLDSGQRIIIPSYLNSNEYNIIEFK
ncbi:darobactin export ABC transporter periplasmic adaptor subunit [Yersinia pekkanenii]|uniref:RND family efflux transporter MFP subunit n=1 Tax=Yersinia pekkanenii TaxID=1288385 RepID=A0A0T9QY85_9GAMM|nr:darobactin export ABC transporter periplasmic adaptor subunit [Yersinia pekkanenii]CNI35194.1 RND family efflux transporter MFP subunit [Yersinia pekkanenii]CRY68302.1 RND family efflux transporter MFP subunit [Yersinia pekkanenii]